MNSEGLSDRFLDYAASIIIIAKIRDRIICDKSGALNLFDDVICEADSLGYIIIWTQFLLFIFYY